MSFCKHVLICTLLLAYLAHASDSDVWKEPLSKWEEDKLKKINLRLGIDLGPKGSVSSNLLNDIKKGIEIAHKELAESGFRIVDPRVRLGICQLMAWYSMEILKEHERGECSLDQFLLQLFTIRDQNRIGEKFTETTHFTENLKRLGIQKAEFGGNKLNDFKILFVHWITFRALSRLLDGGDPTEFLPIGTRWCELEKDKAQKMNEILHQEIPTKKTTAGVSRWDSLAGEYIFIQHGSVSFCFGVSSSFTTTTMGSSSEEV